MTRCGGCTGRFPNGPWNDDRVGHRLLREIPDVFTDGHVRMFLGGVSPQGAY